MAAGDVADVDARQAQGGGAGVLDFNRLAGSVR